MSNDILVLNEAGEEIAGHRSPVIHDDEETVDQASTPSYKQQRSGKKGFRIDDILFSVSHNVLRNSSCLSTVSNSPLSSPSSICSSASSHTTMDEMSPVLYLHDTDAPPPYKREEKSRMESPPTIMARTRSRSLSPTLAHSSPTYGHQCSDGMDLYSSSVNDSKKPRTSFSPDQIQVLEDSFQEKRYLNHTERMILADELNLTDCQIKTWFQNRRMKMKRQYKEAVDKGYLIPYHPYPFPRYSRLTPAHFASLPTLNARRFFGKQSSSRPYPPSSSGSSPPGCHCCSSSRSYSSSRDYMRSNLSAPPHHTGCSDFSQNKTRRGPEVLPCRRSVERRDIRYDSEFNDYFRQLPTKTSPNSDNTNSSNNTTLSTTNVNMTDRNKNFP